MASLKQRFAASALVLGLTGLATIRNHEGDGAAPATAEAPSTHPVYKDPVGVLTVCTGHTGPELRMGMVYTKQMCEDLLRKDTAVAQRAVQRLVKVPITQSQFDGLVSFIYNIGEGNFSSSTMLRKINAGDCMGAGAEFPKWKYARGVELPGLVIRRADERRLWEGGC